MNEFILNIRSQKHNLRIDHFLKEYFKDQKIFISRNFIQKTLHQIKINAKICKKAHQKVKINDLITYTIDSYYFRYLNPFFKMENPIQIPILYEDDFLFIVDKPKNLIVHPALSHDHWSLLHYLQNQLSSFKFHWLQFFNNSKTAYLNLLNPKYSSLLRPGVIHRIDHLSSGLLMLAKSKSSQIQCMNLFKKRKIKKIYLAIVKGIPPQSDRWVDFIGRDPKCRKKFKINPFTIRPRKAITSFKRISILKENPPLSLIKINLITGRTHQIRCHFAHYKFPLIGDPLYGKLEFDFEKKQLALLSYKMLFIHPITKKKIKAKSHLLKSFLLICNHIKHWKNI